MKTIIEHELSDKIFESNDRVVKCPFGKNRRVKDDEIYNQVCDGCLDNWGGWMNSELQINRCYYQKETNKKLKSNL